MDGGFSQGLFSILLVTIIAIAGVVWVSLGIVAKERWPIRWLEINGSFERVSAEQVRSSLAPLANASFFTINLQEMQTVAARNAWVSDVSVVKHWPDTVVVTVEEYKPLVHWNQGKLISPEGTVFGAPEADEIQGLPWLNGPEDRLREVLDYWVRFNAMLETAGLEIDTLDLDQRGSWSMVLNNGTRLQLGRDNASHRLQRLMKSWNQLQRVNDLPPVLVDLRYTNGFAVNWPQETDELALNER